MEEKKSRVPPSKWTALLQTLQRAYKASYVADQFDWIYYLSVIIKFKYTAFFVFSNFYLGCFLETPKNRYSRKKYHGIHSLAKKFHTNLSSFIFCDVIATCIVLFFAMFYIFLLYSEINVCWAIHNLKQEQYVR